MKKLLPAIFISAIALVFLPAMADGKSLSKSDVEGIIKQYLNDHPEVVMDSLKKYQQKQSADQIEKAAGALKSRQADLLHDKNSPVAGNLKGDVTIVEFFDYHCGYCKKMLPTVTDLMKNDPKVRVVFKEFPILSEDSETASKASLAFSKLVPEKYFAYHTALMGISGKFEESKLLEEAKKLGASEDDMKKEMKSDWVKDELKKTKDLASDLYIRGTPGFIIGDVLIPGAASLDDLQKVVSDTRSGKKDKKADKKAKDTGKKNKDDDDADKEDGQGT